MTGQPVFTLPPPTLGSALCRRDALRVGGYGMLGLTLPRLLQAEEQSLAPRPARAKSVVFLYQFGGPSHLDTFDMKLRAPAGIRSLLTPIATSNLDVQICANLPETAKVMDKVTLVRTVHHPMKNHNPAAYYALTGHVPPVDDIRLQDTLDLYPAYGSVVDRLTPPSANPEIPKFVAFPYIIRDGSITPGQHASFLGKPHDPFLITQDPNDAGFNLPELTLPADIDVGRLQERRELLDLINTQKRLYESAGTGQGLGVYYDKAMSMLGSSRVKDAFDLEQEPVALRERYGRTTYGQSCLLARRLIEAGVRFVNVYFSPNIGGQSKTAGGWDTHGFNNTEMYPILKSFHLPITDHTLPVFLNDLDERGLLDETLVIWMGEFGRTPKLNANQSRDHWPQCYTVLMAGGGVKRGYVHGSSDRSGAFPDRDPVPLDDIGATMLDLLGIDPHAELRDKFNRPLPASAGKPITAIYA